MSLRPHECPGCVYGGAHLEGCKNGRSVQIPPIPGFYVPGEQVPVRPDLFNNGRGSEETVFTKAAMEIAACEEAKKVSTDIIDPDCKPGTVDHPPQSFVFNIAPQASIIEQKVMPSSGTKLVCTTCGRGDWHFLVLRRKAGLLEGLCKQLDGSGCYPLASRRSCQYTYPEQIDCPQLAEYCVSLGEQQLSPKHVCRDHIGEMMRQGPLYKVWPLED